MEQSMSRDAFPARLFTVGSGLVVAGLAVTSAFFPNIIPEWLVVFAIATFGLFTSKSLLRFAPDDLRQAESRERVRTAEQDLENALRGLQGTVIHGDVVIRRDETPSDDWGSAEQHEDAQTRLALSELWAVTHRRLDHYHGIALGQAKQSFRNAQVAMGLGFALLVGFVIVALNASTTVGSIVAGGLGAVSAALAGYVGKTFIRSQEAAASHLRAYFDQPLEFSRYLAAERLMADAGLGEEKRAEILSLIVQTMIAGPGGTAPSSGTQDEPSSRP
jgi:hypothetical protein